MKTLFEWDKATLEVNQTYTPPKEFRTAGTRVKVVHIDALDTERGFYINQKLTLSIETDFNTADFEENNTHVLWWCQVRPCEEGSNE